jgi:AcrR family transcriptional regulator
MKKVRRGPERRDEALSRDRIVGAAIELLDDEGESGLTFRSLATRLATGPGAIYWHIANKNELLAAATDAVITRSMALVLTSGTPQAAIRSIALCMFDTIDTHPWVGTRLSHAPWETAIVQIFERIGRQVQSLGVPGAAQFTVGSTLLGYILGVSIQNAAQGRMLATSVKRADFLEAVAAQWKKLDASEYPFTRAAADRLVGHDDREEYVAGIDLILAGIQSGFGHGAVDALSDR